MGLEKTTESTVNFRADHPASSSKWSVRAGMTRSRWFRREAIIPARSSTINSLAHIHCGSRKDCLTSRSP
jgi:hypothetical protein